MTMPFFAFEAFWRILENYQKEKERPEGIHPDEWQEWLEKGEEWVKKQSPSSFF